MKNVYKSWKTTVIGIVILAAAIASIFLAESITWTDASFGVLIGLAMVFVPDDIISRLKTLISKKTNNDENACP